MGQDDEDARRRRSPADAVSRARRPRISRRRALASVVALGAAGTLLTARSRGERSQALPADRLRPPGALAEAPFLDACVRCGLCVQACPYDVLQLAGLGSPVPAGTPYFVARTTACRMCEDIPCVPACPTAALDHALIDIRQARMGVAALSDPQRCYSASGQAYCQRCFQACPIKGQAIRMVQGHTSAGGLFQPVVDPERCTGCGLCEQACILEGDAAITVRVSHAAPSSGSDGHA
jgi:ferredoxin-type protein NapG